MPSELALEVRRLIYDSAIERSMIPSKAAVASAIAVPIQSVEEALTELADAHQLVLQCDSGEVLMANPFSAIPTPFVVSVAGHTWYGNCIWDSMGIAAMVGSSARLDASCGCCGSAMSLSIPGDCRDDDARVAHFAIPAAHWWDDIVFN